MRKLLTGAALCGLLLIPANMAAAQTPTQPRVTVKAGDTLWGIGVRTHRTWPQLASYNHIPNPDLIYVGQVVVIPPASYQPASYVPKQTTTYTPPVQHTTYTTPTYSAPRPQPVVTYRASGFEACVIARESGGNAQIWGGSGGNYWGLYQFSRSTWIANGGSPGSYGNASAAEQHQVFIQSNPGNWAPYDGC